MHTAALQKIIEDILSAAGFPHSGIENNINNRDGAYWFSVTMQNPKLLIGKNGEHLQALNALVRRIVENKHPENQNLRVVVDINNYQKERVENVESVAHMFAERARFFKSSVRVDPMTSFERRVIHEFLKDAADLKTESEGEGRDRHVVIKYIGTIG